MIRNHLLIAVLENDDKHWIEFFSSGMTDAAVRSLCQMIVDGLDEKIKKAEENSVNK